LIAHSAAKFFGWGCCFWSLRISSKAGLSSTRRERTRSGTIDHQHAVVIGAVRQHNVEDEVARYGPKYLDLTFCPSASQAQRIARRKFAQARADTGLLNVDMLRLTAWGLLYAR
jgi:hypothetical protein